MDFVGDHVKTYFSEHRRRPEKYTPKKNLSGLENEQMTSLDSQVPP